MSNRLSSFIPLAPEITQANISSQFSKDTIKVPLPEMTHSEKLEKAEFDTKERKKLAKEKEAMPSGKFPIRNESDLKNAIRDVPRSNNPGAAKSWIKKRAKELDLEEHLPGSWEKATDDELNMFSDKLEKGGLGSGKYAHVKLNGDDNVDIHTNSEPIAGHAGINHEDYKKLSTNEKKKHLTNFKVAMHHSKMKKSVKPKIKKDDSDAGDGGEEMEESVEKAFNNLLGDSRGDIDPIKKAFENVINVTTDPIERAFENLLKKGGVGSGRKKLHIHFGNIEKLHPDDSENVDTHLTGIGTDTKGKDLHYKGKEGKHHVYEYGENTTDEHVKGKIEKIKKDYPELKIEHKIHNSEKKD
jgi:hypothetical protein